MVEANPEAKQAFKEWAIFELMGHRKLAGLLQEVQLAGAPMWRLDVPGPNGQSVTQFYAPAAVYGITPTTEEVCRAFVQGTGAVAPVSRWELALPEGRASAATVNAGEGSPDPAF